MLQAQVPAKLGEANRGATFADVLAVLEMHNPSYEIDLSIRTAIHTPGWLLNKPKTARIFELFVDLDHWVGQLTPASYGSDELLFLDGLQTSNGGMGGM